MNLQCNFCDQISFAISHDRFPVYICCACLIFLWMTNYIEFNNGKWEVAEFIDSFRSLNLFACRTSNNKYRLQLFVIATCLPAIILAILLTSICLLALVRWFVGRNRRQDKEREEEEKILRSSVVSGGYRQGGSVIGSAYPASGVDLDLPPAHSLDVHEQRNYY